MKKYKLFISVFLLLTLLGCEDFLDKEPVDSITDQTAITNLEGAQAALDALYNIFGGGVIPPAMDDAINGNPGDDPFTLHAVQPEDVGSAWNISGQSIHRANNIIQKVPGLSTLTDSQKRQFISEAKFIKAFTYLNAIYMWGDFPWIEEIDYRIVQNLPRTPVEEIFTNLTSDLIEAKQQLPESYNESGETRTRITKGAATALLARTYLYQGEWPQAEEQATEVINNSLYELTEYQNIFIKNSPESILELWSDPFTHSGGGVTYFPPSLGGQYALIPTEKIINAFEVGDLRKNVALNTDDQGLPYIFKFRDVDRTGNFQERKIIRLAELYLIRAEARAKQQNLSGAADDINIIRSRAGLSPITASDQPSLLAAIEQERFVELCFETGHRWIDLARTGRIDEVMEAFSPQTWDATDKLLPIPQAEIDLNPNLTQNPGY